MAAPPPPAGTRNRKRGISEDDVYLILHRYTPATILTALQEVAQHAGSRRGSIDWGAVAGSTTTGIASAREYQMLWRYFAYSHALAENVDSGAQPLGDESDLECDIEPVPAPNNEALAEAADFAKNIIYGSSREQASGQRANSEAPSALNTANEKIVRVPSDKQLAHSHRPTNGTAPVSSSKQSANAGLCPDPLDANGPPKKKKKTKPWSKEEDSELAVGVQKYGEGNWLDILNKCKFDCTRTHYQLAQRWQFICKRHGSTKPATPKVVSSASTEERKAAQKAFSMALDMPMTKTIRPGAPQHIQHNNPMFGAAPMEVKPVIVASLPVPVVPVPAPVQMQIPPPQLHQAPIQAAPPKVSNTSNKSRNNSKKQVAQQNHANVPSSIQAAAIAAGGRIATPSVATNLLKAAQSTKAVHIRSRGTGSSKSSAISKASTMAGEPGTQPGSTQHPEPQNISAPTPSPVLTTHANEQVPDVSEVAGVNPLGQSAGVVHLLETNKTLSTAPVSSSCDNIEIDDESNYFAVTMEDLFPEEAKEADIVDPKSEEILDPKDADMLEFDRFVAQGCLNMDYLDKSKTVKIEPEAQGVVGGQKKELKMPPAVGNCNPIFAGAPATGKKPKTAVPHGGTSSAIVGACKATVPNRTVGGRAPGPGTIGSQNTIQKLHPTNLKGNKIAAPGAITPPINRANAVVNLALKGYPPTSQ